MIYRMGKATYKLWRAEREALAGVSLVEGIRHALPDWRCLHGLDKWLESKQEGYYAEFRQLFDEVNRRCKATGILP